MEEKIANHACMNERFFLEFHMARSNIEMQRKRNRDGALNRQENKKILGGICYA